MRAEGGPANTDCGPFRWIVEDSSPFVTQEGPVGSHFELNRLRLPGKHSIHIQIGGPQIGGPSEDQDNSNPFSGELSARGATEGISISEPVSESELVVSSGVPTSGSAGDRSDGGMVCLAVAPGC